MSDKNITPDEITDEQLESVAGGCHAEQDPVTGEWIDPTTGMPIENEPPTGGPAPLPPLW